MRLFGVAAEGEDGGAPVFGMIAFFFEPQDGLACSLEGHSAGQVSPLDDDFGAFDEQEHAGGQDDGDDGPEGADQEHNGQATESSDESEEPVVHFEGGAEAGVSGDAFVEAGQVDGAVGQEEEHGDDLGGQQDQQGGPQTGIADDGGEPQEHDDAENGQDTGRKNAAEGSKPGGLSAGRGVLGSVSFDLLFPGVCSRCRFTTGIVSVRRKRSI